MFVGGASSTGSLGYQISNSLRLRASASAYLSRTFAGEPTTFTFATWVKRGALGTAQEIACSRNPGTGTPFYMEFSASDVITVYLSNFSANVNMATTAVYRDPSAWYHVVLKSTDGGSMFLYVNGVQVATASAGTGYFSFTNRSGYVNTIGTYGSAGTAYLDGYLSHVHFIDGQALDPSYFGQFNSNNVWTPKAYTGTYGTNGFKLDFSNGSSLTTLGNDASGNGNNWTLNNFSLTAGPTYDWMVDTPTNNYCTLNPLRGYGTAPTQANLTTPTTGTVSGWHGTIGVNSGKRYWEFTVDSTPGVNISVGIWDVDRPVNAAGGAAGSNYGYLGDGRKIDGVTFTAYGSAITAGQTLGISLDCDAGTLAFSIDGVSQGTAFSSGIAGRTWAAYIHYALNTGHHNFGQRPFAYTPPTGFKALCTANLPAVAVPNGKKHFDTLLHTGGASVAQDVTGAQFQPDLVWVKARNTAAHHALFDVVRGANQGLYSSLTNAESTWSGNAFLTNGFRVDRTFSGETNGNGNTYVDWLWKAGGTAVTNNAGTISSQVSVNTAAGFSIVTYTVPASGSFSVGHGLGTSPALVITKSRSGTSNWGVWHKSLTNASDYYLNMNTTAASTLNTGIWGVGHTSSVTGGLIGSSDIASTTAVRYCFAEVAGFSKFGSYIGNGSVDGPFVYCGFRPRWVMVKRTDVAASWYLVDAARNTANVVDLFLYPNLSNAEQQGVAGGYGIDFTSNGFKLRGNGADINASGGTYIFAAFAENPFGGSNVAPATAR